MGEANPIVLVIDDDPEFRDSIVRLLRDGRTRTRQFSSVFDFLKADPSVGPTCLVLDVRLPGRSGLELRRELAAANRQLPIIHRACRRADDRASDEGRRHRVPHKAVP